MPNRANAKNGVSEQPRGLVGFPHLGIDEIIFDMNKLDISHTSTWIGCV